MLILEEIDLDAVEGVYGGHGESYWRRQFGSLSRQLERLRETRKRVPGTHVTVLDRLDVQEQGLITQQDDLHKRASQAGVPRAWRE